MSLRGFDAEVEAAEKNAQFIDFGTRNLEGPLRTAVNAVALVFGIGEFVTILGLIQFDSIVIRPLHLAFAFALCFALYPRRKKNRAPRVPLWDWLLVVTAIVVMGYILTVSERLMIVGPGGANQAELVLGVVALFLILEGARRVVGPAMPTLIADQVRPQIATRQR